MNRLQKKCLVAAAGSHFLLVVLLLCSAFIPSHPRLENLPILEAIPSRTVDAMLNAGVSQPPPPQPAPPQPQPQPQPQPPQPQPQPQPPPPPPQPQPEPEVKETENPLPEPKVTKPKPEHKIEVNLKPVVRKNVKETNDNEAKAQAEAEAEAKAAERAARNARDARAKAFRTAARNIADNAASPTSIELPPGINSEAYANYASVVLSVYTEAWTLPNDTDSDDAITKVSVTIANDGHVLDAHIVQRSGDKSVDNSVQRTLDRVTKIAPFPDGSTDRERTYIIYFNLKAKRQMLG